MKQQLKYDPEDIESLMLAKTFEELLPEERSFVLRHIENEREYESMRHLLLQSISVLQTDTPEPPSALREKVMDEYRSQFREKPQHRFWLNLFSNLWTPIRQRPYIAIAAASVLVFFGVLLWLEPNQESQLAIEQPVERPGRIEQEPAQSTPAGSAEKMDTEQDLAEEKEGPMGNIEQTIEKPVPVNEEPASTAMAETEQSEDADEELEYTARSEDAYPAADEAPAQSLAEVVTESEAGSTMDTDETSNFVQKSQEHLVNDALFAVLYTAR